MNSNPTRNETLQFIFLLSFLVFIFAVFFLTPSIRPASLLTVVNLLFMVPAMRFLMRYKIPKIWAILILFTVYGVFAVFGAIHAAKILIAQWSGLVASLPILGQAVITKLGTIQTDLRTALNIEFDFGLDNFLISFEKNIQDWTISHGPTILGDIFSAGFLSPLFAFFILKDGENWKTELRKMIPQSYAATMVHVVNRTSDALIRFLRAKVLEALLVGLMSYVGLRLVVGAPYSGIFALIAGVTNIIPYLGPILGAAPALVFLGFSDQYVPLFWQAVLVFGIVNAIDMILVFPVFVAKLVNLSPLTLLVSVAVGQEFYGLIGMLLAVPVASIFKIILQEAKQLIYQE